MAKNKSLKRFINDRAAVNVEGEYQSVCFIGNTIFSVWDEKEQAALVKTFRDIADVVASWTMPNEEDF